MRALKYYQECASKNKVRLQQLYFIREFLQSNVKHRVFVKSYSRYGEYFQEYFNYFGRPLIPKNSMYGMTNSEEYLLMISQIV